MIAEHVNLDDAWGGLGRWTAEEMHAPFDGDPRLSGGDARRRLRSSTSPAPATR